MSVTSWAEKLKTSTPLEVNSTEDDEWFVIETDSSLVFVDIKEQLEADNPLVPYHWKSAYNTGEQYQDSSRTGSPLFESRYKGKCWHCDDRWGKGDMVGYPNGYNKPVCSSCHSLLDDFVPYSSDWEV